MDYIKRHGWTVNVDNNFVFDLSEWDFTKPLFDFSFSDKGIIEHLTKVNSKIMGSVKSDNDEERSMSMYDNYEAALRS